MNRPRDPPKQYGQRDIGLDSDRRHTRGGPPQGSRSGLSMTGRRMPDYDEGMDDLVDDFDNMGVDSHKHAAPGRPQDRRGPRYLNDMDTFDEEYIDPRKSSIRGDSQGRTGMGRRRMDDMDGFDRDEVGPRRSSTRGGPQGRRGTGSGYMNNPVTDMVSYVPKGSRAGDNRTGVSRVGAGGSQAGGEHGARLMIDDISHVPRGSRGPRPSTTNSMTPLRELEIELDRAEESERRARRAYHTAMATTTKSSDLTYIAEQKMQIEEVRSMELKHMIYKIDPNSERVDNDTRVFLDLPYDDDGKEGKDPRDHQCLGSRRGGDHGHREDRLDARDHY